MAIKAGQILHVANKFVVDRIQTGGAGQLNIPQEKVYELGNYQSVAIVRDIPDLTFSLDCLDVDTEIEAIFAGSANPTADAAGTAYDFSVASPIDIVSPWKNPYGAFAIVKGVAIPYLTLESVSYKYGVRDKAGETYSLRGDGLFYVPGTPMQDTFTGDNTTTVFNYTAGPALLYTTSGASRYALCVTVNGTRMTVGTEYTATSTGVTFLTAPAAAAKISIVYGTATAGTYAQAVHQGVSVKPAAIKGKDIDVYFSTLTGTAYTVTNKALTTNVATITTSAPHGFSVGNTVYVSIGDAVFDGTYTLTVASGTTFSYARTNANVGTTAASGTAQKSVEVKWPDVQSVQVDWKVQLEQDFEFGNPNAVAYGATDIPGVTGSVGIKPRDVNAFFTRLAQITGVASTDVIGPNSSVAGALRIVLRNPDSGGATSSSAGTVLKTVYVPSARFTIPGYEGRVNQKLEVTMNFESDDGVLLVYKGAKP